MLPILERVDIVPTPLACFSFNRLTTRLVDSGESVLDGCWEAGVAAEDTVGLWKSDSKL
jgi:hypothetical protein